MSMTGKEVPSAVTALRLAKIFAGDDLRLCETVRFAAGSAGVDTVLRRAAIAGRVEVGGDIADHFADMLDDNDSIVETVALDTKSFASLKEHWMRCSYVRPEFTKRKADLYAAIGKQDATLSSAANPERTSHDDRD